LDFDVIYQLIIVICLFVFAANLYLNLRNLKMPQANAQLPEPAPLVSILVPARNEEMNIKPCLESLQRQEYPNLEILVLDDNSTDATANIVRQMAATDPRIRLLNGEPLPEGWAGKPFACYQLAQKARGSWLLFVDVDTTHAPQTLRGVISLSLELKTSLLSGFPRQIATSLPQKIAIPVLYFVILSWFPLWWLQRSRKLRPSLAIGQFLLFRAEDYWRMGGHQVVKSRILEDVWLGIEITRRGGRHRVADLSKMVSCNMYRNVGVMSEGFVRWIYSVSILSPLALVGMMLAGYLFYLAPYYWLWRGFTEPAYTTMWQAIVVFQVVIIFGIRWLLDDHFKEPLVSSILHPVGFSFLLLSGVRAIYRQVTGTGVHWKKRLYDRKSLVD
jgi:chlorobactene glucosyltransferase